MTINITLRRDQIEELVSELDRSLKTNTDLVHSALLDDHIVQKCQYRFTLKTLEGHDHKTNRISSSAKAMLTIEVTLPK